MLTWFGGGMPGLAGGAPPPLRLRERDSTEAYIRRALEELERRGPRAPAPGPRPGRWAARWWRLWPAARHA